MWLNGVRTLTFDQLSEHLDGRLVDREVAGLDDGVEHPDHHLGRQHPSHGGGTGLCSPDHVLLLIFVGLQHLKKASSLYWRWSVSHLEDNKLCETMEPCL